MRTVAVCLVSTLLGVLGTIGLAISGCGEGSEPDVTATTPVVVEYEVRGEVLELPDAETGSRLRIHHEAIPLFMNKKGEITGMDEMAMFFPLGEGVDLSGYDIGDKVRFTMVVDWSPGWYIKTIEKLPPETELFNVAGPAELGG